MTVHVGIVAVQFLEHLTMAKDAIIKAYERECQSLPSTHPISASQQLPYGLLVLLQRPLLRLP